MTSVSVVVVTYRSQDTIAACLRSIPAGTEVLVVDNASDDETVARANESGARVVRNAQNVGFAAAANQGAHATTGDAVLFLNPDAEMHAGCLDRLVEAFDDARDLAVVGPARIASPNGDQTPYWPFPQATHSWLIALGVERLRPRPVTEGGFVVGTCLLVRRDWFERLDGFDENFWLYGEDADLGRRALSLGGKSAVVRGAVIAHIGGHSSARSDTFEQFHRGNDLFIRKHYGAASLVSYRLAVCVGAVIRALAMWPTRRERSRWFARLARREVRLLARQPTTVPPL
jgi:GT2 family glycosyltransferase